jgi:hypothetical protein
VFFRRDDQLPRVASGKVPKFKLAQEALRELDEQSGAGMAHTTGG